MRSQREAAATRWVTSSTERCRALPVDGFENAAFGAGVDGAQRIVEDQDAWVRDERHGERHALLLTARKLHAALADDRVEAVGKRRELGVDARFACGSLDARAILG